MNISKDDLIALLESGKYTHAGLFGWVDKIYEVDYYRDSDDKYMGHGTYVSAGKATAFVAIEDILELGWDNLVGTDVLKQVYDDDYNEKSGEMYEYDFDYKDVECYIDYTDEDECSGTIYIPYEIIDVALANADENELSEDDKWIEYTIKELEV